MYDEAPGAHEIGTSGLLAVWSTPCLLSAKLGPGLLAVLVRQVPPEDGAAAVGPTGSNVADRVDGVGARGRNCSPTASAARSCW